MPKSLPYRAFFIATFAQFAAWLCYSFIGAAAIPCCDDPTPAIPSWYAFTATPILFSVYLVPGVLCGLFVPSRPVLVAALAGGVGAYLSHLFGSYLRAIVFPAWAVGGLGQLQNVWYSFSSIEFNFGVLVTSLCYAAAAAAAASAGILVRSRVRANPSLNAEVPHAVLRPGSGPPVI
jgi:hypothetical protein